MGFHLKSENGTSGDAACSLCTVDLKFCDDCLAKATQRYASGIGSTPCESHNRIQHDLENEQIYRLMSGQRDTVYSAKLPMGIGAAVWYFYVQENYFTMEKLHTLPR